MQQIRRHELGAQSLRAADGLPETARAYAFAQRRLSSRRLSRLGQFRCDGGAFSRIDESSVRAGDDQIRFDLTKLRKDLLHRVACFTLFPKICPGRDLFELNRSRYG